MNWVRETPHAPASCLYSGPVTLSVRPSDRSEQWQFFSLTFGRHSAARHEGCLHTWPHEAIDRARKALDEFEEQLNERTQDRND
jgi:hypothetical protein